MTPNRPRGRPRGTQTRLLHEHAGHLGRHHFAFLRALLDGVELEQAWTRYLAFSGGTSDRRHFVSRLRQVVEAIEHAGARGACAAELAVVLPALRALPDFVPARGARFVDRERPAQADRYGALERSAIYGLLRRFFRDVANAAATREGAPPAAEFTRASTHWLRHTFANEAIKQMQPQVLQSLLGHSDLRVTSVYIKAQAADLVRGMRALPRKR